MLRAMPATRPPGCACGRPDIVTTRSTPSRPATRIALRRSSASSGPTSGSGCSGLPLQFSPAIDTPVPSKVAGTRSA